MTTNDGHAAIREGDRGSRGPDAGVLIVIGGSRRSRCALTDVARALGSRRGPRLCLVHLAPPALAAMAQAGRRAFAEGRAALKRAGVAARALDTQFFGAPDPRELAHHILALARASRCGTVVVGHGSARYRGADLAAQLVEGAAGVTIRVVA